MTLTKLKFVTTAMSWVTMRRGSHLFTDVVTGDGVYEYTDCYGDRFMANYIPYFFRVRR